MQVTLDDCVPVDIRVPGYEAVPAQRLEVSRQSFVHGQRADVMLWLASFTAKGYTNQLAWITIGGTMQRAGEVYVYHAAETPCK